MQASNRVIQPGDIGGPMNMGAGYRWNVPVVTYGFDQSFRDYFGTNGVAAVVSAIQILNSLPPASQIVLTNFPANYKELNPAAIVDGLIDLKSQTLPLLLEHLGLTQPKRNVFVMKQWSSWFAPQNYPALYGMSPKSFLFQYFWPDWFIPDFITMRNFDPQTLAASEYINGALYTAYILVGNGQNPVTIYQADPFSSASGAVADAIFQYGDYAGIFFTGLTYDDVGGLKYLLSTNNVNYEQLLPSVSSADTNSNTFVNGAWRPGVEKITFIAQPFDAQNNTFLPTTNYFTDTFIANGHQVQQQLKRVIAHPDLLFTVGDTGKGDPTIPYISRTGTSNWMNNAIANGNTNGEGPGVIQPPVQIMFAKFAGDFDSFTDEPASVNLQRWGSFDASTNAPIGYPIPQVGTQQMTLRIWLEFGTYPTWFTTSFELKPVSQIGTPYSLQTSTNLSNWVELLTITNSGGIYTYQNYNPLSPRRFYRLIPN